MKNEKETIYTDKAPKAIGVYSQAVKMGNTVYLSGQIPLVPETMKLVSADIETQIHQTFDNLKAVVTAAGGTFADIVKVTIYLIDLNHFAAVNQIMMSYFKQPYPARAVLGVSALPKGAQIEIEGIMVLDCSDDK